MSVAFVACQRGSIDIVGPDGDKGVDVPCESRHEACQNSGNSEAQQTMAIVTHHQCWKGLIVVEPRLETKENGRCEAGKHNQNREKKLHGSSNQRSVDDSSCATRSKGTLDEYKIGAPIPETQDETESHRNAEDIHAGCVWADDRYPDPGMTHGRL